MPNHKAIVCTILLLICPASLRANGSPPDSRRIECEEFLQSTDRAIDQTNVQNPQPRSKLKAEPLPKLYHVMPRLFEGGLWALAGQLESLSRTGVEGIWLGPVHTQTTYNLVGDINNHGYWPKDHSDVDERLGGEVGFRALIQEAHRLNMKVILDAPINHFGYGDTVALGGREASVDSIQNFFLASTTARMRSTDEALIKGASESESEASVLASFDHIALLKLDSGLHELNDENPETVEYLIDSYKRFIDLGVDGIRIDAAKHVSRAVLVRFINELQAYAKNRRVQDKEPLTILVELLVKNENSLFIYMKALLEKVLYPQNVFFIDFPMQDRFTSYALGDGLHNISGFLEFRQRKSQIVPLSHLAPMPSDHDFGFPLKNSNQELVLMALHEFFGLNPSITHHGSEQSGQAHNHRPMIEGFYPNGDKLKMQNAVSLALASPSPISHDKHQFVFLHRDQDALIAKRLFGERALVLVINRKPEPIRVNIAEYKEQLDGAELIYASPQSNFPHTIQNLTNDDDVLTIAPNTVSFFQMDAPNQ